MISSNKTFSITDNLEITIGDDYKAHTIISYVLSKRQGEIIAAMGMGSDLEQIYCTERQKILWDMTGPNGTIPLVRAVKALVRKNIIVPTMTNKEWKIQIALGSTDTRIWKINPAMLKPLKNAVCLIRTIEENLKRGRKFNVDV